jgi:hypothetical protein
MKKWILTMFSIFTTVILLNARVSCEQQFNNDMNKAWIEYENDQNHCGSSSMCNREAALSFNLHIDFALDMYGRCYGC